MTLNESRRGGLRFGWIGPCLFAVAAVCAGAATARADVGDAVWAALKEREVAVETPQGEVRGKLAGVDAKSVVLLKADGTPLTIARATVKNVRAIMPEAAPAAAPVVPSAAPADSASPATPPVAPAVESPPPPHPEADKLVNAFVLVWLTNGERVMGQLTDTDASNLAVKTRTGMRVLRRASVSSISRTPHPSESPSELPDSPPPERTDDAERPDPTPRTVPTRGVWLSADLPVFGVQHLWVDHVGNTTVGSFGFAAAPFNVGIGYQTSDSFLIGARLGIQAVFPEGSDAQLSGKLAARFEGVVGHGTRRGFFAAEPAFAVVSNNNSSQGAFSLALSAGAHLFVADSFSVDPFGEMSYQRVFDTELNGFTLRAGLMFSGWSWSDRE